jgi:hypothetical protein
MKKTIPPVSNIWVASAKYLIFRWKYLPITRMRLV